MPRPDTGTRQKLLETAKGLLWASGYGAVSVDDICREAGVKKGSFYHYFPSKIDLALTVIEAHFKEVVEPDLKKIFAANVPFEQQIDALADLILTKKRQELAEHGHVCGCPMASLGSETLGQDDLGSISVKVEEKFRNCQDMISRAIQNAMNDGSIPQDDAEQKAREIYDFITGLKMMARVHNSLDGIERDLKPGMRRILGLPEHNKKTATTNSI